MFFLQGDWRDLACARVYIFPWLDVRARVPSTESLMWYVNYMGR
jgi:hypothetical protein